MPLALFPIFISVQHIEFFHKDHFENRYHRVPPPKALRHFIDFFWETDFDELWDLYPDNFSDALFPNIGYTYLINLGTPYTMQIGEQKFEMKGDGFLPRHKAIECYHQRGNKLFGIKFRISPVIFEKKVNFSEYKEYMYPLSYLLDQSIIDDVKRKQSFDERISILSPYFQKIVNTNSGSLKEIEIVTSILDRCYTRNEFNITVEDLATEYGVSSRTLQRYFEMATSLSSKNALQIMRIRKATAHLANSPRDFHYSIYGYYDLSHFHKHLKKFLQKTTLENLQPHLKLLSNLKI